MCRRQWSRDKISPCWIRLLFETIRTTVRRGLQKRGLNVDGDLEAFATLENRRRRLIPELEGLKREQNSVRR